MERSVYESFSLESTEQSVEFNFGLDCAQRINALISAVESIAEEGGESPSCVIGTQIHLAEVWSDRRWRGVDFISLDEFRMHGFGNQSRLTLQTCTDGRSIIKVNNLTTDEQGVDSQDGGVFEITNNPYQREVTYTPDGLSRFDMDAIAVSVNMDGLADTDKLEATGLLNLAENKITLMTRHILGKIEGKDDEIQPGNRTEASTSATEANLDELPASLQGPLERAFQIKNILASVEWLSEETEHDIEHILDESSYSFSYTKTNQGQYAKINSTLKCDSPFHPRTGKALFFDTQQVCLQIARTKAGATHVVVDKKLIDRYGNVRHGKDWFVCHQQSGFIVHQIATGFTFDENGRPGRNRLLTDQQDLQNTIEYLLSDIEDILSDIESSPFATS